MIEISNRQILKLEPNTPQWLAHREKCFNASEAPMMMNCSPYAKRSELLRAKATGEWPKTSAFQQKIFDDGHKFEAIARPWAEEIFDQDLFQQVISAVFNGLLLSASFDGLDMFEIDSFEHKMLIVYNVQEMNNGIIGLHYRVQMEQQLMLSGADRVLFMISSGKKQDMQYLFYNHDPQLRQDIIDGWTQFRVDLENYVVPDIVVKPIAEIIDTLPAINVKIHGGIKASNLEVFKTSAQTFIAGINKDLITDEDFVNAEETVKFLIETRAKIKQVKKVALSETVEIETLFDTLDALDSQFQKNSAALAKLIKAEKENKKTALCNAAKTALTDFAREANQRLKRPCIAVAVNFRDVIKGRSSLVSIANEIDSALAEAKINITRREKIIQINLDYYRIKADGYEALFLDLNHLFDNDHDTFKYLIDTRLDEHLAAETVRLAAERLKIQTELNASAKLKEDNDERKRLLGIKESEQAIIDKDKKDKENEQLSKTLADKVADLELNAVGTNRPAKKVISFPATKMKIKPSIEQVANLISIKFCHKHGLDQTEIGLLLEMIRKGYEELIR